MSYVNSEYHSLLYTQNNYNRNIYNDGYHAIRQSNNQFNNIDARNSENNLKKLILLVVVIIELPLAICYLYYAYLQDPCLVENIPNMELNLKTCLLVFGYTSIGIILSTFGIFYSRNQNYRFIFMLYLIIATLFNFIWTIVISVGLWRYHFIDLCSEPILLYLYITTIIRIFMYVVRIINYISEIND